MFTIKADGYTAGEEGGEVTAYCDHTDGAVTVQFDDPEERYYGDPEMLENIDPTAVESWANGAGISVDGNELTLWASTGDPRGAFTFTLRKLDNGEILIHVPHPDRGTQHEDIREMFPGTFVITRTEAAA